MFSVTFTDQSNGFVETFQQLKEQINQISSIELVRFIANIDEFVELIVSSNTLIELDIHNYLTLPYVTDIIKNSKSIRKLRYTISMTNYNLCLKDYFEALSSNTTLTHINFRFTNTGFLSKIIEILKTNNCIRYINLSHTDMQNKHVLELADALKHNKCLESIDLSHNPKIGISATTKLQEACRVNRTLTSIVGSKRYSGLQQYLRRNAKIIEKIANMLINHTNSQPVIYLVKYVYGAVIYNYLIEKKGKKPEVAAKLIKLAENKFNIFVLVAKIPLEISQCVSQCYNPNTQEINDYLMNFRHKHDKKKSSNYPLRSKSK